MTEENNTAKAADEKTAAEEKTSPKKKFKWSMKMSVGLGVIVAVLVVAGAGFWVWHEQPSFCNAICHSPMDAYLPTYESELNEPGIDKWGNEVENTDAMLAPVHRVENETTCLGCHVPVLGEQISEAVNWVTGNYEVVTTQTGMQVIPECSLADLTEARGIEPDQFCLNDSCHNMTREDLAEATEDLGIRNPHAGPHGSYSCSDCHKAHRASVNRCSECHNDVPIPEGWLTYSESANLKKGLN